MDAIPNLHEACKHKSLAIDCEECFDLLDIAEMIQSKAETMAKGELLNFVYDTLYDLRCKWQNDGREYVREFEVPHAITNALDAERSRER